MATGSVDGSVGGGQRHEDIHAAHGWRPFRLDLNPPGITPLGEVSIEPLQFYLTSGVVVVREKFRKPLSVKMMPGGGSGIACLSERLS